MFVQRSATAGSAPSTTAATSRAATVSPTWVAATDLAMTHLAHARTGVVLPGFSDDLLTGFLEDQAHRYLRTKELVPVFYRPEDGVAVRRHVANTVMQDLHRIRSYRTRDQLPTPHPDNLPAILASDGLTLHLPKPLDRAQLIVANSMVELPADDPSGMNQFLSREYPDMNELQVLMHGDPGSEVGMVQSGGRARRIDMDQLGGMLNGIGVGRQHVVRLLSCYAGDVSHPGLETASRLGEPEDSSMAAGLQRYFESTRPDSGPALVVGHHGMGYVGSAGAAYAGASLKRDEPRSLRGEQFIEQALLQHRPGNRVLDPQMAHQMQMTRAVDAMTFYPAARAGIPYPHMRTEGVTTSPPALLDASTQTPQEEPVLAPVPSLAENAATAEVGTQTLSPNRADASTDNPAPAFIHDPRQMFVFPAPMVPLPAASYWQPPVGAAPVQTQDAAVQNVGQFVVDMGTQTQTQTLSAAAAAAQPLVGAPQVRSVYTQIWQAPQTFPVLTQTTETVFDPALRQMQLASSWVPPGHFEMATQVDLEGRSPLLNPLLPPAP